MRGESMPNIKKQFKEICEEYGVVGASLEIYKNNKTNKRKCRKANLKLNKKPFKLSQA